MKSQPGWQKRAVPRIRGVPRCCGAGFEADPGNGKPKIAVVASEPGILLSRWVVGRSFPGQVAARCSSRARAAVRA